MSKDFLSTLAVFTDINEEAVDSLLTHWRSSHPQMRVKERTAELEAKNAELERMNRLFVGRELRMVELKQKINELEQVPPVIVPVKSGEISL